MSTSELLSTSRIAKAFQGHSLHRNRFIPAEIHTLETARDLSARRALSAIRTINERAAGGTVYESTTYQQRQAEIAQEVQLWKEVTILGNMDRSILEVADHIRGRRANPHGFTMQDRHLLRALKTGK